MGTYRPLYSLRVEHDYYDNLACRALAFRLKAGGVDLCRRRGLLFRQTAVNEWTLLYDCDSAGVDTSSDKVEAELCITDPAFVLFTDWAALRPENAYTLELPASRDTVEATEAIRESADRRRIGSGFCSVSILMTEKILAAAQKEKHKTCTLRFHAPQCKWESGHGDTSVRRTGLLNGLHRMFSTAIRLIQIPLYTGFRRMTILIGLP